VRDPRFLLPVTSVGAYWKFVYNRVVGGRVLFRITLDQVRGIYIVGISIVVRFSIRMDSYYKNKVRE
jgi:hypothetical protein